MDGAEAAQARIETYLAAAIAPQLDLIAAAHGLADRNTPRGRDLPGPLPNPKIVPASDIAKLTVKDFPCHSVTILDTLSLDRVEPDLAALEDPNDLDDRSGFEGPQYRVTYLARVFTFARGKDYADTNTARHRHHLAVRMAILGHPSLLSADAGVNESSYRESFSSVDTEAGRTIGAAWAEFRLTVTENLLTAAPNYVETLEVIGTILTATAETA